MEIGKVIKSTGNMPLVKLENKETISCKLRGIFKLKRQKILVGDNVLITTENKEFVIEKVLERKNQLIRPAISNIDQVMIVFSIKDPKISLNLLDTFISVIEDKGNIEIIIIINKSDLDEDNNIKDIVNLYEKIGYKIIEMSTKNEEYITTIKDLLKNKTTALAGPSGVGKTSMLSNIFEKKDLEIGEISRKTNRGKHTTKVVEIFELDDTTFVFDTPGFTTVDLYEIEIPNLENTFKEFRKYIKRCKFRSCSHTKEDFCEIKKQVGLGNISIDRYGRYVDFYEKLKKKSEVREKSNKNYKGKKRFIK